MFWVFKAILINFTISINLKIIYLNLFKIVSSSILKIILSNKNYYKITINIF